MTQVLQSNLKDLLDFTTAYRDDNAPKDFKYITSNKKDFGFHTSAAITITAQNRIDEDTAYGAKVALVTSTRSNRRTPSMMFSKTGAGKLEMGSDKSAATKMKITGNTYSAATAGCWDIYVKPDIRDTKFSYVTNTGGFLDTKTRNIDEIEYSRKITYFTPEMSGFQAGVSYIPDTTNVGSKTMKSSETHITNLVNGHTIDIKDGVAWGVSQAVKLDDDLSFKASLVGEMGRTKPKLNPTPAPGTQPLRFKKLSNLRTYSFGAEMKYAQFALFGCYSNYMKSATTDVDPKDRKKTDLYNIGTKYSFDELTLSISHFASNHRKNKLNATTFAGEYKLAPGLLPYAEVTAYNAKGFDLSSGTPVPDNYRGTLFLVGMKMEF
ncbi:MAG UNVERIFIED_CONTAM: porin [Rickettsiaceae bacterium]|jgi:hypothetical protein